MAEKVLNNLGQGIHSIPTDPEQIPSQSAQDSLGWISTDGQIELCRGRLLIGAEETANGYVKGQGFGYRADGTSVHFRKVNTKIQYYNTTTKLWVDVVTGLTDSAEYTFANYQSLAGTFVYATGADGIYKIHTANPGNFCAMYDASKNFKGKSIIVTSRMHMWDLPTDKTGHYGSYIDAQDSTVYTSVSGEATTSLTGTLAFKAGDAKRTCFGVTITITASGEVYTDNYNGVLTGSLGGTGTINYTTGAYTLSNPGVGTASYQWEMTNNKGITDFTKSATRTAGQGFVFRQDEGGDAILAIVNNNGVYYSLKTNSTYALTIASTDTTATNIVFRRNMGVPFWRALVNTNKGIMFMDTANPEKPQLTILRPNAVGDNLEPYTLARQFDFSEYVWDQCAMDTYSEYIVFSGRTSTSSTNNKLFIYNIRRNTVDILPYFAKTIQTNLGRLYIGDTTTDNVYEILSGYDDDNQLIENYWISGDDTYGSQNLKKLKRLRLKGIISPDQKLEIYFSPDNSSYTLLGTVLGNGSYVDYSETFSVGSTGIGGAQIGGESSENLGSRYYCELKLSQTKFRKRTIKLVSTGIGFLSVDLLVDERIQSFGNKMPSRYRSKQNVSVDGTLTNQ